MVKLMFCAGVLMLSGCKTDPPIQVTTVTVVDNNVPVAQGRVKITQTPINLDFQKTYTTELTEHRTMVLTAASQSRYEILYRDTNGIEWTGILIQADGKNIAFDPFKVADKILEPSLVPQIEAQVRVIRLLDNQYRRNITEFTDQKGNTWSLSK